MPIPQEEFQKQQEEFLLEIKNELRHNNRKVDLLRSDVQKLHMRLDNVERKLKYLEKQ